MPHRIHARPSVGPSVPGSGGVWWSFEVDGGLRWRQRRVTGCGSGGWGAAARANCVLRWRRRLDVGRGSSKWGVEVVVDGGKVAAVGSLQLRRAADISVGALPATASHCAGSFRSAGRAPARPWRRRQHPAGMCGASTRAAAEPVSLFYVAVVAPSAAPRRACQAAIAIGPHGLPFTCCLLVLSSVAPLSFFLHLLARCVPLSFLPVMQQQPA